MRTQDNNPQALHNQGADYHPEALHHDPQALHDQAPNDNQAMQQEQEQQQQAELEAQKQIADMRNSGKVGAMAPQEVERAMALLTQAILSQQYIAANA